MLIKKFNWSEKRLCQCSVEAYESVVRRFKRFSYECQYEPRQTMFTDNIYIHTYSMCLYIFCLHASDLCLISMKNIILYMYIYIFFLVNSSCFIKGWICSVNINFQVLPVKFVHICTCIDLKQINLDYQVMGKYCIFHFSFTIFFFTILSSFKNMITYKNQRVFDQNY